MSQERLSRRLGYKTNVLHLWERGQRFPSIGAFFALAESRHQPVARAVAQFIGEEAASRRVVGGEEARSIDVGQLVQWLGGEHSAAELARLSGIDRMTLGRWRNGVTEPRLPEFLHLLDVTTLRCVEFVALFADPSRIDVTRSAHSALERQRRVAYERPWSHAVLHALDLDEYGGLPRHGSAWIAERLGLGAEAVDAELHALQEAGVVEKVKGAWRKRQVLSVDTRSDFDANRHLKQHWARVAADRSGALRPDSRSLFSYNVFPIAETDLEKLRELHLDYYARVRQVVAQASGADHVVLVNVQLCVLGEL